LLPDGIRVLERGWLSSNNVLLLGRGSAALVDSGYVTHAAQTVALVAHALGGARLERLVNTHCHSDHMGGNAAIQRAHGCRTSIPAGEAPLVERWDEEALLLSYADQRAERFRVDDTFAPGDVLRLGGRDWQVIAAPGHDAHATMLYAPDDRILLSGDALWENGFGVIFGALAGDAAAFADTRATLESIARLEVRTVIPGHGRPFGEVGAALERAYARLAGYEQDVTRLARHAAKVMLTFSLLERRSMPIAGLASYIERVPIMRDINARHLRVSAQALADWLMADLARAGVVERRDGLLLARDAA
jgi:glyoxylase-like metal-dependent hydrolase (beta-lactamase superfamily II)